MKTLLVTVAVLGLASVASADLIVEVTQNPDPAPGLKSYTVTFKGDTPGDAFSAFDGRFDGVMSQCWYEFKGWNKTVWSDFFILPGEADALARDTHLLLDPHDAAHVLIASDPEEDMDTGNVLEIVDAYSRGLGTYLATSAATSMAFAVPRDYQTTDLPFAQIVVPAGQIVTMSGVAVANNGAGVWDFPPVPEPATLSLLALGAALPLMRRKR